MLAQMGATEMTKRNKYLLPDEKLKELRKRLEANPERLRKVKEASERWRWALRRYVGKTEGER